MKDELLAFHLDELKDARFMLEAIADSKDSKATPFERKDDLVNKWKASVEFHERAVAYLKNPIAL